MAQVRQHTESTRSQYGLAETAAGLGWPRTSIEVIDTDLGISGKWGVAREGFTELVTRVCTGEVGAIFGLEITRLARSNADVARLAEFARITGTLLIDPDGVYDPADVNDRVLLGFKSTMGEMELHVMAQRLQANKRAAAQRGELRTPLPVGYVHDDAGDVVIDPDAEVQAAIRDVFAAFAACGSAYGVVAAFKDRKFPLRAYGGAWAGQLRWGRRTNAGARPPREGCALCQGIITCGSCGKPMRTNYHTDARPSYECSSRADRLTTPTCRSVAAATVDDAVARVLLDALTPEQVALALSAADEVAGRHQRVSRAAELAAERARYEADRAERAFHQVEPENRLVARSLEARWETRLAALAEAEQALEAAADALPPLPGRAELEKLAADLPGLWHAPATSNKDRKRLLRTLIADVTLLPEPDQAKVRIGICWHTGATDELSVARAIHPGPAAVCGQRDQRRRGRPPPRLQRRRHLLLDRVRPARRAARSWQPALHHLERPGRDRLPAPHRRIRAPQPGRPPHQATPGRRIVSSSPTMLTASEPANRSSQHRLGQPETSRHVSAGGAV